MRLSHLSETERRCVERYLAELVDALGELEEVVIFGSAARGDMWPAQSAMRSDLDLLVVTSRRVNEATRQLLLDATYPLFLECGRQLGPQFRTRAELTGPFVEQVARDGVVLWRRPTPSRTRVGPRTRGGCHRRGHYGLPGKDVRRPATGCLRPALLETPGPDHAEQQPEPEHPGEKEPEH